LRFCFDFFTARPPSQDWRANFKNYSQKDVNMKHIGLFEGIGGFLLAARWMGWEPVAWCEWDEFCQKVLKYHFPEAQQHGDITKTDFTRYAGQIDILTGGFPCQPYSSAGKRLGKEDDRHLWPEMLRAIREIQPRWVVGENVRGLTNWNGGLVFDEVQADLENEGYEVTPYLLPACAVNAPHRRDRIWFVAYRNESTTRPPGTSGGIESNWGKNDSKPELWSEQAKQHIGCGELLRDVTNSCKEQFKERGNLNGDGPNEAQGGAGVYDRAARLSEDGVSTNACEMRRENGIHGGQQRWQTGERGDLYQKPNWQQFPTQSPICSRNDGISDRLAGITFSKHREKSIGAYGNAIVPQVAYQIFKAIKEYENLKL
jgi:DNA (cytosine-5)-methyltransferase 1